MAEQEGQETEQEGQGTEQQGQAVDRYRFDTAGAWLGRLQNVINSIEATEQTAQADVAALRRSAASLDDWYELTQVNTLRVLLANLRGYANEELWPCFAGLTDTALYDEDTPAIPTYKLRAALQEASTDLEIIQRALDQRRHAVGQRSTQASALLNADVLAAQALKPARAALLENRYTRLVTYFTEVMGVRVLPYDPDVVLVGIPFASVAKREEVDLGPYVRPRLPATGVADMPIALPGVEGEERQIPWDFLALPHEIGHFLYRHGFQGLDANGRPVSTLLMEVLAITQEGWVLRWAEELFADVYGCLIAGPIAVLGLQDILSDTPPAGRLADTGHHPIPALRPFLASDILRRISEQPSHYAMYLDWLYRLDYSNAPDLLDANWEALLCEWGLLRAGQGVDALTFKIRGEATQHGAEEVAHVESYGAAHGGGQDAARDEEDAPRFETLTLPEIRAAVGPVIDAMLRELEMLDMDDPAYPWSQDVQSSLQELEAHLQAKGTRMPIEPFEKQPRRYNFQATRQYYYPQQANDILDTLLSSWGSKGPEVGHGV